MIFFLIWTDSGPPPPEEPEPEQPQEQDGGEEEKNNLGKRLSTNDVRSNITRIKWFFLIFP